MEEDEALLGRNGAAGFEREFTLVGKGGRGQMAGSLTQGGHESRASSLVVGTSTAADGEGEKEGSASSGAVKLDPFPFSTTLVTKEPAEKEPTPPPVKKEPFPPWSEEPNEHTPTAHPQYKESGNLVFGIANSLDTSIFRDVALVGTKATSPLPPKQSASPIAPKKRENTSAVALKKREYVVQTLAETERILRPASVTASEQSVSNSMASEHHPRRTPTPVYPQRYTPTNTFIGNGSYHRNSPALSEQESLVDVPAWQRLVLSSGVSPVYYADLIDEVVRVMGYELFQIQRKPDVYMPVTSHPRRFHRSVDGEQTPFVPPCTKGSLHLYLKRTNKSMPLTPFAGLQHLRVCISRLQLERAQELNPPPINSRNRTITSETEIDRAANIPFEFFTAYREYEPLQSLIPGEMRNVGKSIYRQHRAESFGSYVFPSHEADSGAPVPQVVCVVARGGFGVPVLRTLTKMAGVSGTDGMEFLGMRYMQAMLPFQARIVTPYRVGDVKWAASVRFLAGPVRDVFGDGAVDGDAAFEEAESSTAEEVEEGGEGLMVIVLRKVNAFEEIQSVIASLFESYSSLGFKDARPENDNTLNPEEKMRLSLLVSLNPEMSYATLTAFFRDSDLIPAKWSCGGLTSPDDPEVVSNPGAIPMSLISPPRGHQALLVMKASAGWKCIAVLLQYLSSNGFVLSAFRHIIVGTATASKLVAVPDENVTQREGDEAVTAYIGEDGSVGVRMDGLASWITGAPVIVMVLWGVSASRRLNDLMAKFVIRPGIVKLPQKITDTVNRGETVLSSDVYVPSNYGVGQYQISVLCSKGLPVEIRDYPRQLGRFQRKIFAVFESRLMANLNGQGLPLSPGTNLCTLFAPRTGGTNEQSMNVTEPLAEKISEVVGGGNNFERKAFSVHNILNGPCFAVVLEGGVELASNLRNATASLTPPTNDGNLFAILKHDECRALLPLIQSEMTSFAFRMAVLSAPHAPTSRTSSKVDG
ncbi:hypothetical protein BC830DRAFT_1125317 [Chytriomyces sp. MP71]|nr:hypothetical protein BC830DRAFT_1125317 [Chytriomyces sp. MP71]